MQLQTQARRAVECIEESHGKQKQVRFGKKDLDTIKAALGMKSNVNFQTGAHQQKRAKLIDAFEDPELTVSRNKVLIFD